MSKIGCSGCIFNFDASLLLQTVKHTHPSIPAEVSWCNTAGVCQQTGPTRSPVQRGNTRGEIQTSDTGLLMNHSEDVCSDFVLLLQALALDDIKSHHWCIIGCSAVTGENLLEGVDWLLDDIAARIFSAD